MFNVLSRAILSDLLVHWLPLGDVGKLDSAVCGPVEREQFLALIKADSFGRRTTVGKYCCKSSFLAWVVKRNVNLQLCELVADDVLINSGELQRSFLPLIGPNLKKFIIGKVYIRNNELLDKFILELSLHCTRLVECELATFSDGPITTLLSRNPHMKSVKLNNTVTNKETDILHVISPLCPDIERIEIDCVVSELSLSRFMAAIPAALTCLSLLSADFTHDSLMCVLHQCPNLVELRVDQYDPNAVDDAHAHLVHPNLKLFRARLHEDVSTWIPVLSTVMRNLASLRVLAISREPFCLDTSNNVKLILKSFRHLRQLLVGGLSGEKKLRPLTLLRPLVNSSHGRSATTLPAAGRLLEELFSSRVTEVMKTIKLPALCIVGCDILSYGMVLPNTVRRVVVTGWHYNTDENMLLLHNLEEIELELSSGVSDAGMRHIARQNPHLRVLRITQELKTINSNTLISAAGLWAILQHCPHLHTVVYKVKNYSRSESAADYLLQQMCLHFYPNMKHLEYSV